MAALNLMRSADQRLGWPDRKEQERKRPYLARMAAELSLSTGSIAVNRCARSPSN